VIGVVIVSIITKNHLEKQTVSVFVMNEVYNIRHCIYCGKGGFDDADEVVKHIKLEHMVKADG